MGGLLGGAIFGMNWISHLFSVPLRPCGDEMGFVHSVHKNNWRKKKKTCSVSTAHIYQHQAWPKTRTLQKPPLFLGSEDASGHPRASTPGGSCIIFSLHDLNYTFSMASCVKIPHVRDMRRRGGKKRKTGFEPLCETSRVDSNPNPFLRNVSQREAAALRAAFLPTML